MPAAGGSFSVDIQFLATRIFAGGSDYEDKLGALRELSRIVKLLSKGSLDIRDSSLARADYTQYLHYLDHLDEMLGVLREKGLYSDEPVFNVTAVRI